MECPYCHENAVVEDQLYCEKQKVCESCGAVVAVDDFTDDRPFEEGNFQTFTQGNENKHLPWKFRKELCKSTSNGFKSGKEKIKQLVAKFNLPSNEQSVILHLFINAFALPELKFAKMEKKFALAACCVYITMRQNDYPIARSKICDSADVPIHQLSDVFNIITTKFNIQIASTPIEEILPIFFNDCDLEDKEKVITLTSNIILLARKVWLTDSKKPHAVISGCAYIAWMTLDLNRANVTYDKFCHLCKVQRFTSAKKRVQDIFHMISKLAEKLPWVNTKNLNKRRYLLSCLEPVLQSFNVLCQSAVGSNEENKIRETFVPPPPKKLKTTESNFAILPPGGVSDLPELTDDDIPDDEMHLYIRSEEEVLSLKFIESKDDNA